MSVRAYAYGRYASIRVNRRPRAADSVHVSRGTGPRAPSPRCNEHVHRDHRDGRRSDILTPRDSPLHPRRGLITLPENGHRQPPPRRSGKDRRSSSSLPPVSYLDVGGPKRLQDPTSPESGYRQPPPRRSGKDRGSPGSLPPVTYLDVGGPQKVTGPHIARERPSTTAASTFRKRPP